MAQITQVSSNSIVQQPDVYIEPGTGPAIVPLREPEPEDEFETLDEGEISVEDGDDGPSDFRGTLLPPESVEVLSQVVRQLPDGTSVVDVVLEVEDVLGATKYEVRFV